MKRTFLSLIVASIVMPIAGCVVHETPRRTTVIEERRVVHDHDHDRDHDRDRDRDHGHDHDHDHDHDRD